MAPSPRSKARKPAGQGISPSGRIRLTALLATVAALLLVPASQASAAENQFTLHIAGSGSGSVASKLVTGNPPIECSYESPGPATGVCANELESVEFLTGTESVGIGLVATPAPGSVIHHWVIEEGEAFASCGPEEDHCFATTYETGNILATAVFCLEGQSEAECLGKSSGPTNLGTLSVSKSGSGQGAVSSKPKGIKCGNTCTTADAALYKESTVVLTAKAAVTAGSTFEGWSGCDSETKSSTEGTCTVKMSAAESVVASFGGTGKAVPNAKVLTVSKGGSGEGAVKASGLACEPACTSTEVLYTGGEGKKLPAVVTLSQAPAPGSEFSGWSGCESEPEGKCVVTTSSDVEVTASYAKLPAATLTVDRSEASTGAGSISSKPKGVKCGATCTTGTMALYEGAVVVVTAKAATTAGSTFTGWSGASCTAETKSSTEGTCTISLAGSKTLHAGFGGTKKAVANAQLLTVSKGASTGYGTVKASGLACEVACTTTSVEYTGGEGKKLPALVTLEAISAPGSKTVVWSGCDEEKEGKCVVTMSEAKNVTATFDELE